MNYWSYRKKENSEWWKRNKKVLGFTGLFIGYIFLMGITSVTVPYFLIKPLWGSNIALLFGVIIMGIFVVSLMVVIDYFIYKENFSQLLLDKENRKEEKR
jgi:hypothetical protein